MLGHYALQHGVHCILAAEMCVMPMWQELAVARQILNSPAFSIANELSIKRQRPRSFQDCTLLYGRRPPATFAPAAAGLFARSLRLLAAAPFVAGSRRLDGWVNAGSLLFALFWS